MDFPVSISVIMATYNTEIPMLKEAVDSILNQTFSDFEFIIVDDGSTNDSGEYLRSLSDKRVKIIWSPENNGITKSLNIGLREAKGKYIARMDADDVSLPTRFEREFRFMEENPDVIVCGAGTCRIDERGNLCEINKLRKPEDMETYRVRLLFMNPGPIHPTAFFRHDVLIENKILYDERLIYAQDYGLWETLSHLGRITILDEIVLYRRKSEKQITIAKRDEQIKCDEMTQKKILSALLGDVSDAEVDFHYIHSSGKFERAVINSEINKWYERLLEANRNRHIYDQGKLRKRIITIKKNLIRQTIKNDPSTPKARLVFRYLPFFPAVRAFIGIMVR